MSSQVIPGRASLGATCEANRVSRRASGERRRETGRGTRVKSEGKKGGARGEKGEKGEGEVRAVGVVTPPSAIVSHPDRKMDADR